jgi:hypothetical protein
MAIPVDVVLVGLAQGHDAVFEHRPAVAEDQPRRQAQFGILSRDELIPTSCGE